MNTELPPDNIYIADLHCDTIMQMQRGYDISKRHDTYHIDIPRMIQGGINLEVFACSADPHEKDPHPFETVDAQLDVLLSEIEKNSDTVGLCRNLTDAYELKAANKISVLLAIEGGEPLSGDLKNLEYFHSRGVRMITIAHERSPGWCTCCQEKDPELEGLTGLGCEMIAEMNRLGIIIDLSHSSIETFRKVLEVSGAPVIASHSCAYSLCSHARNLTDEQIKAIAAGGGLIGVGFIHILLSPDYSKKTHAFWNSHLVEINAITRLFTSNIPEKEKERQMEKYQEIIAEHDRFVADVRPSITDIADHIDYIVDLAGMDHVAIGSDFDGVSTLPVGLEDCSCMPNLIAELLTRGYSTTDTGNIMGSNFLRVFELIQNS
ncbi:MAG: dipeptidase [Candidatus Zixiibacteriota bacterium]|nr:MAG: dipeptidase [candidate division Zixibacteria bacterium]